jgi:hypothetical protein
VYVFSSNYISKTYRSILFDKVTENDVATIIPVLMQVIHVMGVISFGLLFYTGIIDEQSVYIKDIQSENFERTAPPIMLYSILRVLEYMGRSLKIIWRTF